MNLNIESHLATVKANMPELHISNKPFGPVIFVVRKGKVSGTHSNSTWTHKQAIAVTWGLQQDHMALDGTMPVIVDNWQD